MNVLREGLIILPTKGNGGEDLSSVLVQLQTALNVAFGGSTLIAGIGSWVDEEAGTVQQEDVINFLVAGEDSVTNHAVLRDIALRYGALANQKSVYLRNFNGDVAIMQVHPQQQVQAA